MMGWKHEPLRERVRTLLLGGSVLVMIGLIFYLGARSERSGFIREVVDPGFRKLSDPVLNAFRGRPPAVTRMVLALEPAALDSLEARSERAFRDRHLDPANNQPLPAQMEINGHVRTVQVMLHDGPLLTGIPRQWPIQVLAAAGDTILGLRTFDLIPLVDEAPLWSILHQAIRSDQGLAAMGAGIAEVSVNGRASALHVLFGQPDNTAFAAWSHGSGPVLRFDDGLYRTATMAMDERGFPSLSPPQGDWLSAPLLVQGADDALRANRARQAIGRMEGFRSGKLMASQVFAPYELAKSMALCDLLGVAAALDWWNLRFLVDSTTEQLIPLPQHITTHAPISATLAEEALARVSAPPGREFVDRALSDPLIHDLYLTYLDSFSTPGWLEVVRARTEPQWARTRAVINAEKPRVDLDFAIVEHDRQVIRQALHPKNLALAYVTDTLVATDGVVIANVHALPLLVTGVVLSTGDTTRFQTPLRLAPRLRDQPLRYTYLPMSVPGSPREVIVKLNSTVAPRSVRIRTWSSFGAN
jgi:hypothetical protein